MSIERRDLTLALFALLTMGSCSSTFVGMWLIVVTRQWRCMREWKRFRLTTVCSILLTSYWLIWFGVHHDSNIVTVIIVAILTAHFMYRQTIQNIWWFNAYRNREGQ